jgi:signal transduction histidine kinase
VQNGVNERLTIAVCASFLPEAKRVAEEERWPDVDIRAFPCTCAFGSGAGRAPEGLKDETGNLFFVGGPCLGPRTRTALRLDTCFDILAPAGLVGQWIEKGAYLVTPAWLRHWRRHVDTLGFDAATARDFFQESMRVVLFLDTEGSPEDGGRLTEFSDFIGLPAERIVVGLEGIRLQLACVVHEWRQKAATARAADLATALDLLERIMERVTEKEVVDGIVDIFTMLFAPRCVSYASVSGGKVLAVHSPSNAAGEEARDEMLLYAAGSARGVMPTAAGDGFLASIRLAGEIVGLIRVEGVMLSEHLERYRELAHAIVGVCGLAVANARAMAQVRMLDGERIRSGRLESIGLLASGLAHDLNNPLMAIQSHAAVIRSRVGSSSPLRSSADAIVSSVGRAAEIVERLLAAAALQTMSIMKTDLNELAERSAVAFRSLLDPRIRIEMALSDAPLPVEADAGKMETALRQLASNAGTAMSQGGVLTVRTGIAGGNAFLSIKDTGIGMDSETIEHLFEPYFTTGDFGGSAGWGMALVHGILRQHGGDIRVSSVPGRGTTFTLTLPLAPSSA